MRVTVFHNVYADSEGRHVRMFDGYRGGDPLVPVITYDDWDDKGDAAVRDVAFFTFNVGETELATRYRDARNRSLSIGDVLRLVDMHGDARWYSCERAGWAPLSEPPADSIVRTTTHGTTYAAPCVSCGAHALVYDGEYGAPGVGQAWRCHLCGTEHSRVGGTLQLASDMAHILRPEDVI